MIPSEPYFQENILSSVFRNFSYYLTYQNWFVVWGGTMVLLYGIYRVLHSAIKRPQTPYFPPKKVTFDKHSLLDWCGVSLCGLTIIFYCIAMFSSEPSLFNNVDMMSVNTIGIFNEGVTPYFMLKDRLSPFGGIDLNIAYAFTHNFYLHAFYVFCQLLLVVYLFYRLTDFIPVFQRFLMLTAIIMLPSFFGINLIVFPERLLLIFVLASLLFIKKFSETGQKSSLWFFVLFMNLAVYTKETLILFYAGILIALVLTDVWNEKITLSSFIHPFKTMRLLPLETLIFFSALGFSLIFLWTASGIIENEYASLRIKTLEEAAYFYRYEIIIGILALLTALGKIKKKCFLFQEGVLFGCLFSMFFIVYILKIVPVFYSYDNKTYYLLIPTIFCLYYIFSNIKNHKIIVLLFIIFFSWAIISDYQNYKNEPGKIYRKTAEKIINLLQERPNKTIYISDGAPMTWWEFKAWNSAFKYYFPEEKITFKYPLDTKDMFFIPSLGEPYFHDTKWADKPADGDLVMHKKEPSSDKILYKLVSPSPILYSNQFFEIYEAKEKNHTAY